MSNICQKEKLTFDLKPSKLAFHALLPAAFLLLLSSSLPDAQRSTLGHGGVKNCFSLNFIHPLW
jgi:hypothetical protein